MLVLSGLCLLFYVFSWTIILEQLFFCVLGSFSLLFWSRSIVVIFTGLQQQKLLIKKGKICSNNNNNYPNKSNPFPPQIKKYELKNDLIVFFSSPLLLQID